MLSKNFQLLNDLPIYDLHSEFLKLINSKKISWHPQIEDQICLNSTEDDPENFLLGRGSLIWDWDDFAQGSTNTKMVKRKEKILKESDFKKLCPQYKGTLFESVYNELEKKYVLGRVRVMQSYPKTCLSWHTDTSPRVHYPMKTQEGCFMIIEDEVKHLPENTWWWTNTVVKHTAMNASKESRLHLVATILEIK